MKKCKVIFLFSLILFINGCVKDLEDIQSDSSSNETSDTFLLDTTWEGDIKETLEFSTTDYIFDIIDKRENGTSLLGKYVAEINPNIYFEISENNAVLHYAFGNYAGFYCEEAQDQIMEIYEKEGVVWLDFRYILKETSGSYLVRFYSKGDAFAWDSEMDHMTYLFYKE